jgi:hypothetical protein
MPLVDRADGGHLWVNPPREVWERAELTADELSAWSFLIAAAAQAMLQTLPQLAGGCINYWEAGNWALNDLAPPPGPKDPHRHRKVHMHLLGRSPRARHADWLWGESPRFPAYADSKQWAAGFASLDAHECDTIASRTRIILRERYGLE